MERIRLAGAELELHTWGRGRTILFLHAEDYFAEHAPFLTLLGRKHHVAAPRHPGFGASTLPPSFRSVEDLAYLYLDLLDALKIEKPILAGASLGGWIALEMAVRAPERFDRLALLGTVGVKLGGREERDFADIYQIPEEEMRRLTFADPSRFVPKYPALSQAELEAIARDRQSTWHFAWRPYMHNPTLKTWLHRVRMPTLLVWGAQDGVVKPAYAEALCRALPQARLETVAAAGHYPQIEQPENVAAMIDTFART